MKVGQIVPINTGVIICESKYPELDLHYFGIKYYDLVLQTERIIFVEKKQLYKLHSLTYTPNAQSISVVNHLNEKTLTVEPKISV